MNSLEEKLSVLVAQVRVQGEAGEKTDNKTAYHHLLEACVPVIRQNVRFHLSRFGNQSFAEDVVQEVLLALHQKLHSYDARYAFLPWLRAVTRHKAIDFLRKNRMQTVSLDEEGAPEIEDVSSQQDATAARDLDVLLKRLKPPVGEIIYMLKIEGMTIAELAQKFKLRESNVKVIIHRGLAKLTQMVLQDNLRDNVEVA